MCQICPWIATAFGLSGSTEGVGRNPRISLLILLAKGGRRIPAAVFMKCSIYIAIRRFCTNGDGKQGSVLAHCDLAHYVPRMTLGGVLSYLRSPVVQVRV